MTPEEAATEKCPFCEKQFKRVMVHAERMHPEAWEGWLQARFDEQNRRERREVYDAQRRKAGRRAIRRGEQF